MADEEVKHPAPALAEEDSSEAEVKAYDDAAIPMPFEGLSNAEWAGEAGIKVTHVAPGVVTLHNVVTADECARLIRESEKVGFGSTGFQTRTRNNTRLAVLSASSATALWARAHKHIPADMRVVPKERSVAQVGHGGQGEWHIHGLNECFRICKYESGGHFGPHCDGIYERSEDDRSILTFLVYLNDGMEGGTTDVLKDDTPLEHDEEGRFLASDEHIVARIVPEVGMVLVMWQHTHLHQGAVLKSGVKYIMRSDIMFARDLSSKPEVTPEHKEALRLLKLAQAAEADGRFKDSWPLYTEAFRLNPELERAV